MKDDLPLLIGFLCDSKMTSLINGNFIYKYGKIYLLYLFEK